MFCLLLHCDWSLFVSVLFVNCLSLVYYLTVFCLLFVYVMLPSYTVILCTFSYIVYLASLTDPHQHPWLHDSNIWVCKGFAVGGTDVVQPCSSNSMFHFCMSVILKKKGHNYVSHVRHSQQWDNDRSNQSVKMSHSNMSCVSCSKQWDGVSYCMSQWRWDTMTYSIVSCSELKYNDMSHVIVKMRHNDTTHVSQTSQYSTLVQWF